MLCLARPRWVQIRGTKESDWYIREGEPFGVRHLCRAGVAKLGVELEPGEIIRATIAVEPV